MNLIHAARFWDAAPTLANVSVSSCSSRTMVFHETQPNGYVAVATLQTQAHQLPFTQERIRDEGGLGKKQSWLLKACMDRVGITVSVPLLQGHFSPQQSAL